MQLDFHNGLTGAKLEQATRLIVRDNFGQPLMIVLEEAPNRLVVYKATDKEFNRLLASMGHYQPAKVSKLDLKAGDFQIE
jgi:hypothetical protein